MDREFSKEMKSQWAGFEDRIASWTLGGGAMPLVKFMRLHISNKQQRTVLMTEMREQNKFF